MASRKKKASHSTNVGCLVLLLGGIILLVVFAAKFPDIKQTLEKTKFFDLVAQRITTTKAPRTPTTVPTTVPVTVPTTVATAVGQPAQSSNEKIIPSTTLQSPPFVKTATAVQGSSRQTSLFFVNIGGDGQIASREVKRSVASTDSPLTDAIKALIAGPSEAEIRSGLVSLIPHGTKLLSVAVKGGTAIIDLSDAFMYNRYGTEGFSAQLRQIVFTATSFASVRDVQILVDGKAKDYLGGEGIYIGKPLSRSSL
jgi:spore germination protein GerM